MTMDKVLKDLISRLSLSIPVVLPNKQASGKHVRAYVLPRIPNTLTFGINRISDHQGSVQFDVFSPVGQGSATEIVEEIINTFPFGVYTTITNDQYDVIRAYELAPEDKPITQGVYVDTVRVDFRFFNQ